MHQNKRIQTKLMIKGVGLVEVVTLMGLATIIKKSRASILRYEKADIFPEAPIKVRSVRYYPLTLAKRLAPLVAMLPQYKKPDASIICEINKLFKEERDKLLCQKQSQ